MATYAALPLSAGTRFLTRQTADRRFAALLVTALTPLAIAIHGYHPYAEDGGLYLAGVKHLLDPSLYPHGTAFVTEHLRFSLFAPSVAAIARVCHLDPHVGLPLLLLLLHAASIWGTLYAAWLLASRCFQSRSARAGAVALLACWLDLPVAGTALLLMDPYLTARSFSTPCILLALVGTLDATDHRSSNERRRGLLLCAGSLSFALLLHPLMASYGFGSALVLACLRIPRRKVQVLATSALCVASIAVAALLNAKAPAESAAYLRIVMTRPYWFLQAWHWYELAGLAAPVAILLWINRRKQHNASAQEVAWPPAQTQAQTQALTRAQSLAQMAAIVGATAFVVAAIFAREHAATHLVARLQPLRAFQVVYAVMILNLGAALGESFLHHRLARWIACLGLLSGIALFAARETYPSSNHLELPWIATINPWERAFLWARDHTLKDAYFALDADYISLADEDAQCFRALAERSALPDYSKDGGEASITPALTNEWIAGQTAQSHLSAATTTDPERVAALRPHRIGWLVLQQTTPTAFSCPYSNATVKVCRLP